MITLQFRIQRQSVMSSIRDFVPLLKLGEGTYSTVYKVRRLSDQQVYALKKVKMSQLTTKEKENALNQIRILASIQSPNIISYKEAFFDEAINVLCIIMEFANGGDLHQIVTETKKRKALIEEHQIWAATRSILLALQNLHSRAIMHRDLKSANVFKSNDGYKLGDLNVSKVVAGNLAYTQTGTPYYASPEVWRDEPYDAKSDIWSLGCIIYEMAALRPPYEGKDMEELFKNVQTRPVPSLSTCYSRELSQLVQLCLKKKASQRLTAKELLEYPYFQKHFKAHARNQQNVIGDQNARENTKKKAELLQTIKLPSDLTQLREKLPNSKYDSAKRNKSQVVQSANIQKNYRSPTKVEEKKVNKSEVYLSPPPRMNLAEPYVLMKSPASEVQLNSKVTETIAKYSDRLQTSQKRSNKVQRYEPNRQDGRVYLNVDRYIQQQFCRRPLQNSLPRTQKKLRSKVTQQLLVPMSSESLIRNDMEQMRRKLVKKTRVVSSNNGQGNWWS